MGASSGSSKSKGVTTLISKHIQFKCIKQSRDEAGRMLLLLCEIQGKSLILANVYAEPLIAFAIKLQCEKIRFSNSIRCNLSHVTFNKQKAKK